MARVTADAETVEMGRKIVHHDAPGILGWDTLCGHVDRTDYAAVNARGVTLYTFSDLEKGRAWVRNNACLHDGLTLEEVQITARRIYRPRTVSRARDFAVPSMPAVA